METSQGALLKPSGEGWGGPGRGRIKAALCHLLNALWRAKVKDTLPVLLEVSGLEWIT